jgi:hypothetical protein
MMDLTRNFVKEESEKILVDFQNELSNIINNDFKNLDGPFEFEIGPFSNHGKSN